MPNTDQPEKPVLSSFTSIADDEKVKELIALRADLLQRYNDAGKRGIVANSRKQFLLAQVAGVASRIPLDDFTLGGVEPKLDALAIAEADAHAERALCQEQLKEVNAQLERLSYSSFESTATRGMEAATKLAERAVAQPLSTTGGLITEADLAAGQRLLTQSRKVPEDVWVMIDSFLGLDWAKVESAAAEVERDGAVLLYRIKVKQKRP